MYLPINSVYLPYASRKTKYLRLLVMQYTEEQKQKVLTLIFNDVSGGLALRRSLKDRNLPAITFYKWMDKYPDKAKQYARATEIRSELMAEDILSICDSTGDDIITNELGQEITNHNVIQRDRLRVDTRKWLMSKMMPKKYGNNSEVHQTNTNINTTFSEISEKEKRDLRDELENEL